MPQKPNNTWVSSNSYAKYKDITNAYKAKPRHEHILCVPDDYITPILVFPTPNTPDCH